MCITGGKQFLEGFMHFTCSIQIAVPDYWFLCMSSASLNKIVIWRYLDWPTTSLANSVKILSHFIKCSLGMLHITPHNHKFTCYLFYFLGHSHPHRSPHNFQIKKKNINEAEFPHINFGIFTFQFCYSLSPFSTGNPFKQITFFFLQKSLIFFFYLLRTWRFFLLTTWAWTFIPDPKFSFTWEVTVFI